MNLDQESKIQPIQPARKFHLGLVALTFAVLQMLLIISISLKIRPMGTILLMNISWPSFILILLSVIVTIIGGIDIYLASGKMPNNAILALITVMTILLPDYSASVVSYIDIFAALFTIIFLFFWITELILALISLRPAKQKKKSFDEISSGGKGTASTGQFSELSYAEPLNADVASLILKRRMIALARISIALVMLGDIAGTILILTLPK